MVNDEKHRRNAAQTVYNPEKDGAIEAEGDKSVIGALVQQAQNFKEGKESSDIRVALFILPGGMRGVGAGGIVSAIHDKNITNGLRVVVGGSTGAHVGAWLLAGNPELGTTIFSEECVAPELHFIDPRRIPDGHAMDVQTLSQLYRGEIGNKSLDVEKIRESYPDFLIALTEYETGKGVLMDGKTGPLIDMIEASSAPGPLYTNPIYIGDTRYGDASAGAYLPVKEVIERYRPTHILVVANCPKKFHDSPIEVLADQALSSLTLPEPFRNAWLRREKTLRESIEFLQKSGIPNLIIWSDNAVQPLSRDAKKIKATGDRARQFMSDLIDEVQT